MDASMRQSESRPLSWMNARRADGRKVYEFLAACGVIERLSNAGKDP
jgi:hypothetical protein